MIGENAQLPFLNAKKNNAFRLIATAYENKLPFSSYPYLKLIADIFHIAT